MFSLSLSLSRAPLPSRRPVSRARPPCHREPEVAHATSALASMLYYIRCAIVMLY